MTESFEATSRYGYSGEKEEVIILLRREPLDSMGRS